MNNKFFKTIMTDNSCNQVWWIEHIDWLYDDDKFSKDIGWSKGTKRSLTNYINNQIHIEIIKNNELKKTNSINYDKEFAFFTSSEAYCVDFFRHIRNAIAHNRAIIKTVKNQKYILFEDYKNKNCKEKTAEIYIKIDTLISICKKYNSLVKISSKKITQKQAAA